MARRRARKQPDEELPEPQTTVTKFDYEAALERGKLSDDELNAVVDQFVHTTSPVELGVRLNLPADLVREALTSPATRQAIVERALGDSVGWFSTVAVMKLRREIEATNDPDVLVKLVKTLRDVLVYSEKFTKPRRTPGRPRNPEPEEETKGYDEQVTG